MKKLIKYVQQRKSRGSLHPKSFAHRNPFTKKYKLVKNTWQQSGKEVRGVPRTESASHRGYCRQNTFQVRVFRCGYSTYDLSLPGAITVPTLSSIFQRLIFSRQSKQNAPRIARGILCAKNPKAAKMFPLYQRKVGHSSVKSDKNMKFS